MTYNMWSQLSFSFCSSLSKSFWWQTNFKKAPKSHYLDSVGNSTKKFSHFQVLYRVGEGVLIRVTFNTEMNERGHFARSESGNNTDQCQVTTQVRVRWLNRYSLSRNQADVSLWLQGKRPKLGYIQVLHCSQTGH